METPSHLFDKVATVARRQEFLDDGGCPAALYTPVAGLQSVACRLQPYNGRELEVRSREGQIVTHIMHVGNVDIRTSDIITCLGVAYRAVGELDPDLQGVFKVILLEQII